MICLMPNCAYLSETSRMISIYRALRALGVDAAIATHGGTHEALLRSQGIPYDIVGPRMSDERCRQFVRDGVGMGRPDQSMYAPEEMRTYVKAEAAYLRDRGVTAVVTGFVLTALLSSRLAGIPIMAEHAGSYIPPVFERGLLPPASNPPMPVFKLMPKSLAGWLQNKGAPRLKLYTGGFNALAAELGVEPIPSLPALLMGDLSLVTEAPEVLGISREAMDSWRPSGGAYRAGSRLKYTGPIFAELDLPVPESVETALNGPRPLVYVALTSTPPELVRRVVSELSASGLRLIVAATVHDMAGLASPSVTVGGVLPSHKIMPRVDAAVVTGGQGSVQCAMAAGIPIVGIPLQPEQDANLAFLARRGAALPLATRQVGRGVLPTMARKLLDDPTHRAAAASIKTAYAKLDGPKLTAQAIVDYLAERPSVTRDAVAA
jgi:UDP:flavonoid glycosyltransferase YjiC (YdhE family)